MTEIPELGTRWHGERENPWDGMPSREHLIEALKHYEEALDVPTFFDFEDLAPDAVHALAAAARVIVAGGNEY